MDTPHEQDVRTRDDQLVIRIKVGGRSINGRFPRPAHVVKEVIRKARAYRPADIIAKLTDDNVLIPAGAKYSAKDIQTWHNMLAANSRRTIGRIQRNQVIPISSACSNGGTEGAHTAIGEVPRLPDPTFALPGKHREAVKAQRNAARFVVEFRTLARKIEPQVNVRGQNKVIDAQLAQLNQKWDTAVTLSLPKAEDETFNSNVVY